METIFKILIAPLLWLFHACSPLGNPVDEEKSDNHYYNKSKTDIQYSPRGNWFEIQNTKMNADVESFEVLTRYLSRDKNRIYFEAYPVINPNFDFSSLYVKNEEFMSSTAFDTNNIYTFSKEFIDDDSFGYNGIATLVEKANPLTFQRTDSEWAKDGTYHFFYNNRIEADYDSFEVINWNFAKDNSQTFVKINDKFVAFEGDSKTLKSLGNSQNTIDKANVYWIRYDDDNKSQLTTIPFTDINEVNYLDEVFIKVKDSVYYKGKVIPDADAITFNVVSYRYSKDAKHVYYENKIIENADAESFKKSTRAFEDKNGKYRDGKLVD